jgi:NADPH:quinone reductase-like Zn-dependent oxidoreductase
MKAIVVEHRGDLGSLREFPQPSFASHEILVRVTAAGVNPMDWKVRDRGDRALPFVLGQDFAGVVSAAGDRVSKFRVGERVFGIARNHGAYAEYTVVPEDDHVQPVAKIPDDVGDADAAALPTAGLTALAAMSALAIAKGTTLLVLGATGGVGSFAVQMARDRGAFVIGTARDSNEILAHDLGVEEFVEYNRDNVNEKVGAAHPDGIDALLDLVDDARNEPGCRTGPRRRQSCFDHRLGRRGLVCAAQHRCGQSRNAANSRILADRATESRGTD